jgi:glycosyltransferase involved in cell wall biosynthesis
MTKKYHNMTNNKGKKNNTVLFNAPKVFIVMPVYNWEKFLLEQLMSIYFQNFKNWELIIINDWSTDSSLTIIDNFINTYDLKNKIKVISKKNWGVNSAIEMWLTYIQHICNECYKNVYISYCDADDIRSRNKLERQINFMQTNPNYWLSYHDLSIVDKNWTLLYSSWFWKSYANNSFLYLSTVSFHTVSTAIMFKACYLKKIIPLPIWSWIYQDSWTVLVLSYNRIEFWFINQVLWYYRRWHDSLTSNTSKFSDWFTARYQMLLFLYKNTKYKNKDLEYALSYNKLLIDYKYSTIKKYIIIFTKYPKVLLFYTKAIFYKLLLTLKKGLQYRYQ